MDHPSFSETESDALLFGETFSIRNKRSSRQNSHFQCRQKKDEESGDDDGRGRQYIEGAAAAATRSAVE